MRIYHNYAWESFQNGYDAKVSVIFFECSLRRPQRRVSGNPSQYDDLKVFIEEQMVIRRLFDDSILTKVEFDISDNDIASVVERIADWIESTGGLYMVD